MNIRKDSVSSVTTSTTTTGTATTVNTVQINAQDNSFNNNNNNNTIKTSINNPSAYRYSPPLVARDIDVDPAKLEKFKRILSTNPINLGILIKYK